MSEAIKAYSWSKTSNGRGRRSETVTAGFWVIEHIATGKFISGVSSNVSEETDRQLSALQDQTHPCKAFRKIYNMDSDLRISEYPMGKKAGAHKALQSIRNTAYPQYLVL